MLLSWGQFVNSFRLFFVTFRHSMYLCVPNPGVAWRLCVLFLKHRHFLHFFRSLNQFLIGSFFFVMQCWSPSPSIHLFLQSEVILLHFFHVAFCKFIIWQSSSSFNERCFARLVFPSILTYMPPYTCSCKCRILYVLGTCYAHVLGRSKMLAWFSLAFSLLENYRNHPCLDLRNWLCFILSCFSLQLFVV